MVLSAFFRVHFFEIQPRPAKLHRVDHDARFKMLLKAPAILRGFFDAFLPEVARFIDFGVLEFVDKERYAADRTKRTGDLLIKTRFQGKPAGFLIHLEHPFDSRFEIRD